METKKSTDLKKSIVVRPEHYLAPQYEIFKFEKEGKSSP
jgi:hypothetical protein